MAPARAGVRGGDLDPGPAGRRVITGSANLSLAAFEGRQQELIVTFDGEHAWSTFASFYQRDWQDSVPVAPDERPH